MFAFLRKIQPLGAKDIPLGKFIDGYALCSPLYTFNEDVMYRGATREVHCRVLIPDGPQGYRVIKVPATVKTVGALLHYLETSCDFQLKR